MRYLATATLLLGLNLGCTNSDAPKNEPASATVASSQKTDSASPQEAKPTTDATADETSAEEASSKSFDLGDPAPVFENITGVDDQSHSLADYSDAKAVALIFTCNHCPVAVAYEDRLIELDKDYEEDVELIAVNVNNMEADKLPAMQERASEKGFDFPYLYDPTQQIGRDYGATVTPHVFLLDGDRRLAYVGAIDDNMNGAEVTEHYLRDAIDAVLAGDAPKTAQTKPVGCGIEYE